MVLYFLMKMPKGHVFLIVLLSFGLLHSLSAQSKTSLVRFKIFPQDYTLELKGELLKPEKIQAELRYYRISPPCTLVIKAEGYKPKRLQIAGNLTSVEEKLEKEQSPLVLQAELPTGEQPKSVVFTPDGKYALVAQLSGAGISVYNALDLSFEKEIDIPPAGKKSTGYVEFAFLEDQNEIWVSQMTVAKIHVLDLNTFEYKGSFSSGGTWSKVILSDPALSFSFVSNWISLDVSVIDNLSHKVLRKLPCKGIPRGLAVSHDKRFLYVANYDTGYIEKFSLETWKREGILGKGPGAARHILIHPTKDILYCSDMARGEVQVYNLKTDTLIKRIPLAQKLNSMDLSPDGRYLFVSSRGHNNPETYLKKGPDFGTFWVLNTETLEKVAWVWGRNQPTGVGVHPQKPLVAFTDFLDDNVEFYDFSALYAQAPEKTETN